MTVRRFAGCALRASCAALLRRTARASLAVIACLAVRPVPAASQATTTPRAAGLLDAAATVTLDSAAIAASPARTLAELLAGRVPGLNVTYATGAPGFAPEVNARGTASTFGSARPLLYVDGVLHREDRHLLGPELDRYKPGEPWNLPTSEIAEVQVVPGPAAGALMPFGSARGAVLVRTRRGGSGDWLLTAFVDATRQPAPDYGDRVVVGGLTVDGPTDFCPLTDQATGFCIATAPVRFRPYGGRSPFRAALGSSAGVAAAGDLGPATLRTGATFDRSPSVLPGGAFERLDLSAVAASRAWRGLTGTLALRYARTGGDHARWAGEDGIARLGAIALQPDDTNFDRVARDADSLLARALPYTADRTSAALDLQWAARPWLTAYALATAERVTRGSDRAQELYQAGPPQAPAGSLRERSSFRQGMGALTVGARATRALGGRWRLTGEAGGHVVNTDQHERLLERFTPAGAAPLEDDRRLPLDVRSRAVFTAARLQWDAHRWIGGGFRRETSRMFGQGFGDDAFNALQAGWTITEERRLPRLPGVERLHLRAAYGESGDHEAVLEAFRFAGNWGTGLGQNRPRLQRTIEREAGADLDLRGGRATLRATIFRRALRDGYLAAGAAFPAPPLSLGSWVTNGAEWAFTVRSRAEGALRWDATLHGSSQRTRITAMNAPGFDARLLGGARARFAEGRPFGEISAARFFFSDRNADGVIDVTEITVGTGAPAGVTQPTRLAGLAVAATWRGWLSAGLTLDGKFGQVKYDGTGRAACAALVCADLYDRDAPLARQARAVASGYSATFTGPVHDAGFVRARDLWIRAAVPARFTPVGAQGATVTLALRNAATWTRYPAGDPETGSFVWAGVQRGDLFTPALPRLLTLRVDVAP